mmetsp:Transcript_9292/g.20968  ORF Transcript_9292/g.20968 Transcript_9292/m.20968 type:complete len:261 (+) Transcript_9292:383-1165(+)
MTHNDLQGKFQIFLLGICRRGYCWLYHCNYFLDSLLCLFLDNSNLGSSGCFSGNILLLLLLTFYFFFSFLFFCCSLFIPCQTLRSQLLHHGLIKSLLIRVFDIQLGLFGQEIIHHTTFQRILHLRSHLFIVHTISRRSFLGSLILQTLNLLINLIRWYLDILQTRHLIHGHANLKITYDVRLGNILVLDKVLGTNQLLNLLVLHARTAHVTHHHGVLLPRLVRHERIRNGNVHDFRDGLAERLVTRAHVFLGVLGVDGGF